MDPQHFWDAYDFIKPALMRTLVPGQEWRIQPMFTAAVAGQFTNHFVDAYEELMGAPLLTRTLMPLRGVGRESYLSTGEWKGHLFYDPTTGVDVGDGTYSRKHIKIDELCAAVADRPNSLTVVYDQSSLRVKIPKADQLGQKLQELHGCDAHGFAYVTQAPFLILSRDEDLISASCDNLASAALSTNRIIGCV